MFQKKILQYTFEKVNYLPGKEISNSCSCWWKTGLESEIPPTVFSEPKISQEL